MQLSCACECVPEERKGVAEERGGNEGENVHRFASPASAWPNSTLRSVTPFDQLVAALDDDSIVGTDNPDYPLQ